MSASSHTNATVAMNSLQQVLCAFAATRSPPCIYIYIYINNSEYLMNNAQLFRPEPPKPCTTGLRQASVHRTCIELFFGGPFSIATQGIQNVLRNAEG